MLKIVAANWIEHKLRTTQTRSLITNLINNLKITEQIEPQKEQFQFRELEVTKTPQFKLSKKSSCYSFSSFWSKHLQTMLTCLP